MTKTKALALFVGVVGSLFYLKVAFFPTGTWRDYHLAGVKAYQQGNYPEAEKQLHLAIKEAEKLPLDDIRMHMSLNNLAEIYRLQAKYADAEPVIKRVLLIDEETLGREHPNVAASLLRLAGNYSRQGKYAEAEPLYQRALAIDEKTLGPEHPLLIPILLNYADLLRTTGRGGDAARLDQRAQAIMDQDRKSLFPDNPPGGR